MAVLAGWENFLPKLRIDPAVGGAAIRHFP